MGIIKAIAATGDYVAATINYRFSDEAIWPAQIFDCKAAIRFLRGKADEYGIDPDHIGVMGASAGGQLVCVLGTCNDPAMEGSLGDFPKVESRVQCVVNFFGPTDFMTFFGKDVSIESVRGKNTAMRVLGDTDEVIRENARTASAVTWISKDDAPFLTAHGTKDNLVSFAQAEELDAALRKSGVESHLIAMEGAGHGFSNAELNERIGRFLNLHLKGEPGEISSAPIQVN
jgi:acetyl esterase/lipase